MRAKTFASALENDFARGLSVASDDIDFGDEDFHGSNVPQFDISDVRVTAFRNKGLTKIDIVLKSDTPMCAMKLYAALKAYVFKYELEMNIFEEDEGEH